MKKRVISSMAMMLCYVAALAQQFVVDGIKYNVTSTDPVTVEVSRNDPKYSGDIVIPEKVAYGKDIYSVTSIGDMAFYDCSGLTSVTIPNSVTSIGYRAFSGCSGLTSITIPNSVTSIGKYTFSGCSGLTSVNIPNSVTSIEASAFLSCSGLTCITVEAGNAVYNSRNNCNAIIKTASNELIIGCKNTVIPNSVTSIGGCAFYYCSGLTSITIPNSVTSIVNSAFNFCSGLTSVTINVTDPIAIDSDCFPNRANAMLYVPIGSKAAYEAADGWKEFDKIEELFTGTLADEQGIRYTANSDHTCYVSGHEDSHNASIIIPVIFKGRTVTSIGDNAFEGCDILTAVMIPYTVTSFGDRAFFGCNGLNAVSVSSRNPAIITKDVFTNRESTTLYVPKDCIDVYQSVEFWNDFNLVEYFTGTVTDEQGVKYTANGDGTCFVSGHEDSYNASVVIPNLFQGNIVTSIGSSAFSGCSGLTSITIPNSVTRIGVHAFSSCSGLTSVNIPNSVTSIGVYAFSSCSGLTSVNIPNSVTSIEASAFSSCSGLTSVNIPNSVTSIKAGAFQSCSGLICITVESGNAVYNSRNNCNAIIKTASNELITGCKNTVIPNSVTSIGVSAFSGCSGLTNIDIPNSVTSIGVSAFQDCSGLTNIDIPNSVTSIGSSAFSYCRGLTSIDIPNSVTSIGSSAFCYCSELTSVTIPNSVTSISRRLFEGCSSLTSISIPNSLASIGDNAFSWCRCLTSVNIPNSVTSIGNSAFAYCSGLTFVTIGTTTPIAIEDDCFKYSNIANATLYVPTGCIEAYQAADNWKNFNMIEELFIGTVTDGQGVKYTANSDLTCYVSGYEDNCNATIVIPMAIKGRTVSSIGNNAFKNCSGLTSVVIPNSVTNIGSGAFSGGSGLTSVTVDSKTPIGITGDVFTNRTNATLYVLAGCVEAYHAVDYWKDFNKIEETLTGTIADDQGVIYTANNDGTTCYVSGHRGSYSSSIVIPEIFQGRAVTSFGSVAFKGCSGLTSVTIPSTVTSIGGNHFRECSGLTSITVESGNSYYDSRNNCNAIVSSSDNILITGCKNTVIPSSVTSIGELAFYACGLTSVTIPEGVTTIGYEAFWSNNILTSVTIPSSVTSIGARAFMRCNNLVSITIPDGVESIEHQTFSDCRCLDSIIIPSSVTSIGDYAFYYCSCLTSVTIPISVTSIGKEAFFGCSRLTSVTVEWDAPIEVGSEAFGWGINDKTLYVPRGTKELYEVAEVWKDFKEIVEYDRPFTFGTSDVAVSLRQKIKLPIELTNLEETVAYQFDLTLPEGFTLAKDSKGQYLVKKTGRYEDENQILEVTQLEDGSYRIVCFSMEKGKITGTSGPVLNVFVVMDHDMALGDYQGSISNIVLTKADQQQKRMKTDDFVITVNDLAEGDSNGDGELNVSDIVEIVNYIMQKPSGQFVLKTADLNGDGDVNVTDVVVLVDVIMAPEASRSSERGLNVGTDNDQLTFFGSEGQPFSLWLTNEATYVASQFDIRLSAGQSLENVTLNNRRADGHLLTCEEIGTGLYRVVVFSLTGSAYRGDNGELLNISVKGQGEVSIENILFVTADATEKRFADLSSGTTAIGTAHLLAEPADIYTTDGRLVRRQATSLSGLPKGVYIVNGKKEVVK